MEHGRYLRSLDIAANQFKLALQVSAAAHGDTLPQKLVGMTYGKFALSKEELALCPEDAQRASTALQHCATFILAVTVDTALENTIPQRFDGDNAAAARIARVIRNAFTHDPFYPRWNLTNPNHIGRFEIPDVITVDTTDLNGQPVEWQDYGGPLALLKFVEHCKQLIAEA